MRAVVRAWVGVRGSLGRGALAAALLAGVFAAPASARNDRRAAEMAPLVEATTACFADHILASRAARARAQGGDWYGAAGLVAPLCRPEVDAMVRRHDALNGFGSGARFFTGSYTHGLARILAARVKLETVDTADAAHATPASAPDEPAPEAPSAEPHS